MTISVNKLQQLISAGKNILISGPGGTGKTQMILKATEQAGLKVKYFNGATMDPFADLVGIPIPTEDGKDVNYARPHEVDAADVIFVDELNRAEKKVRNSIFEMMQFHKINGDVLPNLKSVVSAVNPVEEGYDTEEMDVSLVDRFDFFLEAEPRADYSYFKSVFGKDYARAGIDVFKRYQNAYKNDNRSSKNKMGYFSPRRLEILMKNFKDFPSRETITQSLRQDIIIDTRQAEIDFKVALSIMPAPKKQESNQFNRNKVVSYLNREDVFFRSTRNASSIIACYEEIVLHENDDGVKELKNEFENKIVRAFSRSITPERMKYLGYQKILKQLPGNKVQEMTKNWNKAKVNSYRTMIFNL